MIPMQTLLDIMEFALDNTYVKDMKGNIYKQEMGIPMGDPHSPGMAIITCAWMEKEWMRNVDHDSKKTPVRAPPQRERKTISRRGYCVIVIVRSQVSVWLW